MSIDFPKEEEAVLTRWKEIKAFETQVELSKGKAVRFWEPTFPLLHQILGLSDIYRFLYSRNMF